MNEDKKIIDAEFKEIPKEPNSKEESIEVAYYTTRQVAEIIEEPDSTVRYWSRFFEKHLQLIYSNKNRAFTKQDVERLLQIKNLKERGMTLKQIDDYFLSNGFEGKEGVVDTKNPLAIETFMSTLTSEMDKKMENFQKDLTEKVMASMLAMQKMVLASQEKSQEDFKNQIVLTIDEAVTDKMSDFTDDLKGVTNKLGDSMSEKVESSLKNVSDGFEKIDKVLEQNKELENKINDFVARDENRDKEIVDRLRVIVEENRKVALEQENLKEANKGFFSKIFGK